MIVRALIGSSICLSLIATGISINSNGIIVSDTAQAAAESTAHKRHDAAPRRLIGTASWYGPGFNGKKMASGARFDRRRLTAAHRSLPLGTKARVTNLENGRSVEVTVTDRGPYVRGRIIDLSERAAQLIGIKEDGLARVAIELVNG